MEPSTSNVIMTGLAQAQANSHVALKKLGRSSEFMPITDRLYEIRDRLDEAIKKVSLGQRGDRSDHLPDHNVLEDDIATVIILLVELAHTKKLFVSSALVEKINLYKKLAKA